MHCLLRISAALAVAGLLLITGGCDWAQPKEPTDEARSASERTFARKLQAACSSPATYDRLKQVAFDEAIRIRNADPVNLDKLAAHAFVRVEQPRVVSRDETLDVTVCEGRFVLQLPPGAERAFSGEHQLVADIEYAAQAAADGSGLVYQIKGAEPIIYKLAAFDLKSQAAPTSVAQMDAESTKRGTVDKSEAKIESSAQVSRASRPQIVSPRTPQAREAEPPPVERSANPSFNCRYARSRTEKMVCGSAQLATLDRAMSSMYYSALSNADAQRRTALRRTRDRFLEHRERCRNERCVAQTYRDRMDEIDDIAQGR